MNFSKNFKKNFKKENYKHGFAAVLFFLVSLSITLIWFKKGLLFATSEEGPVFYSLTRTAHIYNGVWANWGFGFPYSIGLPMSFSVKTLSLFSFLFNNLQIQFGVFTLLIFSAISGAYLLTYRITHNYFISIISGLFYFFNLYSMSQVWRRSLYAGIYSWAYLPIFTLLLIKWFEDGKIKTLLFFTIINFLFLWIFANPGYVFSFVAIPFCYIVYTLTSKVLRKNFLSFTLRAFIFGLFFLVINLWWGYPYISNARSTFNDAALSGSSIDSLRGVSVYFPLSQILVLRQSYYFDSIANPQMPNMSWGTWYEGVFPNIISIGILFLFLYGIWTWRKEKYWSLLVIVSIVGLFITKGSNAPLGGLFYRFIFDKLSFTSALRNPYEKFGIVWLLPYSVFFGIGIFNFFTKIGTKLKPFFISLTLVFVFIFLVWPLWNGNVFENYSWVKIPDYYQNLNSYLVNLNQKSRVAVLPLVPDAYARFNWGYQGVEPSSYLFDGVTMANRIDREIYSLKYNEFKHTLETAGDLETILKELNIKYLIVRNDLDWHSVNSVSPIEIKNDLAKFTYIKYVKNFGQLDLYEYTKSEDGYITVSGKSVPTINYQKISNGRYQVDIKNATEPFTLILKESFDKGWKAKMNGTEISDHSMIYNYANAWEVNKMGNYTINVYFRVWPWE